MNSISKSTSDRLRIIVLGYIVRGPLGGLAWHHLQYVMGLSRLGHDVYFVEDSDDYPSCYDPSRNILGTDPSYGLQFTARTFVKIGLAERWTYYDAHTSRWLGPCADLILQVCTTADLLLNISGVNPLRLLISRLNKPLISDYFEPHENFSNYFNRNRLGRFRFVFRSSSDQSEIESMLR